MAIISNVNILCTNAATEGVATCLYYLKETLKDAGWKVLSSSNGTTLTGYLTGTVGDDSITSVNVMNSASAWFRITDPSEGREFVFMRGSTATTAVIKYSKASKFAFSGSASLLPTTNGGDGAVLLSSQTTDVLARSGSHGSTFMTTSGITNSRFHFIVNDSYNSATDLVYPWYMFGLQTVTNTILCMYSHEAVQNGSYSPSDSDPSWFIVGTSAASLNLVDGTSQDGTWSSTPARAQYKYGLVGASFEKAIGQTYSGVSNVGQSYPANLGTNPYDGKDTAMHFLVRGFSFPKGLSTGLKYRGMLRTYPDILSNVYYGEGAVFPTDDWYVYLDKLLVPWPSGSTPTTSS
jgi:hypothetical protein